MLTKLKNRKEGFTIIEVLIVLAIAGLILLIVFLAVPALQRNSRNTQRKDDVARLGGAVQEFVNNNQGKTPATAGAQAATDLDTIFNNAGNLAQYQRADALATASGTQAVLTNTQLANVRLVVGAKCDSAAGNIGRTTNTGASSRSMAIQYMSETTGNPTALCQDI